VAPLDVFSQIPDPGLADRGGVSQRRGPRRALKNLPGPLEPALEGGGVNFAALVVGTVTVRTSSAGFALINSGWMSLGGMT
jgi:hypothetical protein